MRDKKPGSVNAHEMPPEVAEWLRMNGQQFETAVITKALINDARLGECIAVLKAAIYEKWGYHALYVEPEPLGTIHTMLATPDHSHDIRRDFVLFADMYRYFLDVLVNGIPVENSDE